MHWPIIYLHIPVYRSSGVGVLDGKRQLSMQNATDQYGTAADWNEPISTHAIELSP